MMTRVLALSVLLLVGQMPALAQARETDSQKVERLQREVSALQRKVFGVDASGNIATPQAPVAQDSGDRAMLADLSAKMMSVERQLRAITGRMEELEYKQRQVDETLDLMQREMALQRDEMAQAAASRPAPAANAALPPETKPAEQPKPVEPAVALPVGEPAAQYQYAFAFIQKNDLENGRVAMEKFLAANPKDALVGNAKFWLGRIYMLQDKPAQAAKQFLALIEDHPNHDKRADALVDLAEVLMGLGSASDACNALAEFRRSEGKASDRLKNRAARLATQAQCG